MRSHRGGFLGRGCSMSAPGSRAKCSSSSVKGRPRSLATVFSDCRRCPQHGAMAGRTRRASQGEGSGRAAGLRWSPSGLWEWESRWRPSVLILGAAPLETGEAVHDGRDQWADIGACFAARSKCALGRRRNAVGIDREGQDGREGQGWDTLRRAFASSPDAALLLGEKPALRCRFVAAARVVSTTAGHATCALGRGPAREGFHHRTLRRNFPSWVSVTPPVVSSTKPQSFEKVRALCIAIDLRRSPQPSCVIAKILAKRFRRKSVRLALLRSVEDSQQRNNEL